MSEPVTVRILEREYTIGATDEERDSLISAARLLDSRMRELRGNNKMTPIDRLAVLSALNFAHELQQQKTQSVVGNAPASAFALVDEANHKLDALLI
jgi:cell division protein ZapA